MGGIRAEGVLIYRIQTEFLLEFGFQYNFLKHLKGPVPEYLLSCFMIRLTLPLNHSITTLLNN